MILLHLSLCVLCDVFIGNFKASFLFHAFGRVLREKLLFPSESFLSLSLSHSKLSPLSHCYYYYLIQKKPLFPVTSSNSSSSSSHKRRSTHSPTGSVIISPTPPPRRKEEPHHHSPHNDGNVSAVAAAIAGASLRNGNGSAPSPGGDGRGRPVARKKQDLLANQGRVSSEMNLGSRAAAAAAAAGGRNRQLDVCHKKERSLSLTPCPDTTNNRRRGRPQSEKDIFSSPTFVFPFLPS